MDRPWLATVAAGRRLQFGLSVGSIKGRLVCERDGGDAPREWGRITRHLPGWLGHDRSVGAGREFDRERGGGSPEPQPVDRQRADLPDRRGHPELVGPDARGSFQYVALGAVRRPHGELDLRRRTWSRSGRSGPG